MKILVLILLLAVSAQAQSVIYRVGPVPAKALHVDTVTASVALAALVPSDSGFIIKSVDYGDINGDGKVSLSDVVSLAYYILMGDRPAPVGKLISQLSVSGKDSIQVMYILVDSVGVRLPK